MRDKEVSSLKSILIGAVAASLFVGATTAWAGGPAVNQFEIKDLEVEVGGVEFQSQNAHSFGQPRRKVFAEEPGEFEFDENTVVRQRHALELEFGITTFFRTRVGIEFEKERIEEPSSLAMADAFDALVLEEVALEGVFVAVPVPEQGGLGLGALVEYQYPTESSEPQSIVFGPIVQFEHGPWTATTNLTFVHFFAGDAAERDAKWDFFYASQLMYKASETWTFALEAYGTIDRLGNSGTRREPQELFGDFNQHRLGPIVYYAFDAGPSPLSQLRTDNGMVSVGDEVDANDGGEPDQVAVSIGTGVLFGVNENTPDATLKWSVEIEF